MDLTVNEPGVYNTVFYSLKHYHMRQMLIGFLTRVLLMLYSCRFLFTATIVCLHNNYTTRFDIIELFSGWRVIELLVWNALWLVTTLVVIVVWCGKETQVILSTLFCFLYTTHITFCHSMFILCVFYFSLQMSTFLCHVACFPIWHIWMIHFLCVCCWFMEFF
jgi:hypothetical protein